MSAVVPFLLLVLTGAFAAYHRLRLATWVALAVTALVIGWLLGAGATATAVAAVLLALVAVPLLVELYSLAAHDAVKPGLRLAWLALLAVVAGAAAHGAWRGRAATPDAPPPEG